MTTPLIASMTSTPNAGRTSENFPGQVSAPPLRPQGLVSLGRHVAHLVSKDRPQRRIRQGRRVWRSDLRVVCFPRRLVVLEGAHACSHDQRLRCPGHPDPFLLVSDAYPFGARTTMESITEIRFAQTILDIVPEPPLKTRMHRAGEPRLVSARSGHVQTVCHDAHPRKPLPKAVEDRCACWWWKTRSGSPPASRRGSRRRASPTDVALDGTDGLWMARENPYDAIVLDIMLPGMNGYRVCATLRERGDLDADPDADREGRRVRRGRGAGHRRRRLRDQAVLLRRAGRAAAGA